MQKKESQDVQSRKKIRDYKDYIVFHLDFIVSDNWILDMLGGPKQLATQTPTERHGGIPMKWYILHTLAENLPIAQRIKEFR